MLIMMLILGKAHNQICQTINTEIQNKDNNQEDDKNKFIEIPPTNIKIKNGMKFF